MTGLIPTQLIADDEVYFYWKKMGQLSILEITALYFQMNPFYPLTEVDGPHVTSLHKLGLEIDVSTIRQLLRTLELRSGISKDQKCSIDEWLVIFENLKIDVPASLTSMNELGTTNLSFEDILKTVSGRPGSPEYPITEKNQRERNRLQAAVYRLKHNNPNLTHKEICKKLAATAEPAYEASTIRGYTKSPDALILAQLARAE